LLRIVPTACGQAADIALVTRPRAHGDFRRPCHAITFSTLGDCVSVATLRRDRLSERSYLFTMSDITHPRGASRLADGCKRRSLRTSGAPTGGARRDRTDDLLLAKQALSQLSYGPSGYRGTEVSTGEEHARLPTDSYRSLKWWAWEDLNFRPHAYQARALTN
jgi:hypothetical protein